MASRLSARSKQPCHTSFSTAGIRARGACCPPLPAPWAACTHQDTMAFLRACPGECNASLHLCIHFSICLCLFLQTHKPEKASSQQKLPVHTNLHAGQWCSPVLGVEALMFPFTALQKINCFHAALCPGGQGVHPAHSDTVCSQHPESSAHTKACTAQHPAALQHQAWLAGRAGTACSAQEPCPSTSQQAWPQHSARAAPRKGHITAHTSRTGNQTQPRAQCLIRVCLAESSPRALATPELAARPGR